MNFTIKLDTEAKTVEVTESDSQAPATETTAPDYTDATVNAVEFSLRAVYSMRHSIQMMITHPKTPLLPADLQMVEHYLKKYDAIHVGVLEKDPLEAVCDSLANRVLSLDLALYCVALGATK